MFGVWGVFDRASCRLLALLEDPTGGVTSDPYGGGSGGGSVSRLQLKSAFENRILIIQFWENRCGVGIRCCLGNFCM